MPDANEQLARAKRCLRALSVGDAFGEALGDETKDSKLIRLRLFPKRRPWRWTDDTAMAISIVEVLESHGRIDEDALAQAFLRRWHGDPGRGYGLGVHLILQHVLDGAAWRDEARAAFDGTGSAGNGAAMRAGPVGAYFAPDLERVRDEALKSAAPTHAHPDGAAGAVAIAIVAALAIEGVPAERWLDEAIRWTPEGKTRNGIRRAVEVGPNMDVDLAGEELGTGCLIRARDTVPFALWVSARHPDDYEAAVWEATSEIGDRDTLGAIVGSIVGCSAAVPVLWLEATEPLGQVRTKP